ncbi:hypothetical protein I7I50_00288 [Histoplasma capsulatum G186AR]|uniref:Uncharacterized protein n=1 Tax=Ajellomyces capsulatus TaxID=5037 RepID=A0A8H8CUN3_AJECA|nr:hypothetical protein I7I52_07556 [Histoplasma capsulatum]QSS72438.1 hypothetical protein I7I50_00288 [Histoplasma capsulatum G186AR]
MLFHPSRWASMKRRPRCGTAPARTRYRLAEGPMRLSAARPFILRHTNCGTGFSEFGGGLQDADA